MTCACGRDDSCKGPGNMDHIKSWYRNKLTTKQILESIMRCCGSRREDGPGPMMSCPCWRATEELFRRYKERGWLK